jgi:hypothetical protein
MVKTAVASNVRYLQVVNEFKRIRGSVNKATMFFSRLSSLFLNRSTSSFGNEKKAASTADAHAEKRSKTAVRIKYSRL